MIDQIKEIAGLQRHYSSDNTPAMERRGHIIRKDLPSSMKVQWEQFKAALGQFSVDMDVEGSDGIGRKTQAPWVRIFSKSLSPSATTGFYMVLHFSLNGEYCFVTVGCGASKWVKEKGDLVKYSDEELNKKVTWAKGVLIKEGADISFFSDKISLESDHALPRSFEKATVLCKKYSVNLVSETEMIESISKALNLLSIIYKHYSQLNDLPLSDIADIEIESIVNPSKTNKGFRQGYNLIGPERKAVELRAMEVTRDYLIGLGYELKDTSTNNPYDYLAIKGSEQIKVEVKGTTSSFVDSVMMTSNEVQLHSEEAGTTALSIVRGIVFNKRGIEAACSGGDIEFIYPWFIHEWSLIPKAFLVSRSDSESSV
jgi:hypothetical protein